MRLSLLKQKRIDLKKLESRLKIACDKKQRFETKYCRKYITIFRNAISKHKKGLLKIETDTGLTRHEFKKLYQQSHM
jgi:hypothetical protein